MSDHSKNESIGIEKYDGSFEQDDSGVTIIPTETIRAIRNMDLLGFYSFLVSLPKTWKINVKHLSAHFDCNKDKIYKSIDRLIAIGLLTKTVRREKGRFLPPHYRLHLRQIVQQPPVLEKPETVQPDTVNPETYKTCTTPSLENKEVNVVVAQQPTTIISKKEKFESDALSDEKNTSLFERKFKDRDVSIEQIFKKCQEYNEPKSRWVGVDLFHKWLEMENPENYTKKGSPQSMQSASSINHDELVLRSRYKNFIESAVEQRILRTRKGYQSPSYEQWKAKNA